MRYLPLILAASLLSATPPNETAITMGAGGTILNGKLGPGFAKEGVIGPFSEFNYAGDPITINGLPFRPKLAAMKNGKVVRLVLEWSGQAGDLTAYASMKEFISSAVRAEMAKPESSSRGPFGGDAKNIHWNTSPSIDLGTVVTLEFAPNGGESRKKQLVVLSWYYPNKTFVDQEFANALAKTLQSKAPPAKKRPTP